MVSYSEKEFFKVGAMSLASQGRWLLLPPLDHLEGQGGGTLGGGGFEDGVPHPLLIASSFLWSSGPYSQLFFNFHQEESSAWKVLSLVEKGAVELALPSLGYYSCLFVVWKVMG